MKMLSSILSLCLAAFFLMSGKPAEKEILSANFPHITKPYKATGFSFIRAHRQGKGITVSWGAVVQGSANFMIEKTYSDPYDQFSVWEVVGSVPANGSRSYKFNDESVFPGLSNYRITAISSDGTVDHSDIVTVRIVSR